MYERFTIEEINLMCIFDISDRKTLIAELTVAIIDFDEPELIEIAENALGILTKMSDEDFSAFGFYPEYEEYDEEEV